MCQELNAIYMKLIIGIGNPGEKYKNTRHNVGFMVIEAMASQISNFQFSISNQIQNYNFQTKKNLHCRMLQEKNVIFAKSQTFMNQSGKTVSAFVNFYKVKPDDLYVIHDDLDIRLGEYKIQKGVGPKLHNGIKSIDEVLGRKDYWRVRVGVENRRREFSIFNFQFPKNIIPGEKYVLQKFTEQELLAVKNVIDKVIIELVQKIKNNQVTTS